MLCNGKMQTFAVFTKNKINVADIKGDLDTEFIQVVYR